MQWRNFLEDIGPRGCECDDKSLSMVPVFFENGERQKVSYLTVTGALTGTLFFGPWPLRSPVRFFFVFFFCFVFALTLRFFPFAFIAMTTTPSKEEEQHKCLECKVYRTSNALRSHKSRVHKKIICLTIEEGECEGVYFCHANFFFGRVNQSREECSRLFDLSCLCWRIHLRWWLWATCAHA